VKPKDKEDEVSTSSSNGDEVPQPTGTKKRAPGSNAKTLTRRFLLGALRVVAEVLLSRKSGGK